MNIMPVSFPGKPAKLPWERLALLGVTVTKDDWFESAGHYLGTDQAGKTVTLGQMICDLMDARDSANQRIAAARGLLSPLGNQPVPSVLAIREALNILQ